MKSTHQNAAHIASHGGAIAASDWTTGTGRYISKRAIPALCSEIDSSDVHKLKGKSLKAAQRLLRERPRVRKIIVVDDWRSLNRIIKNG